MIKRNGPSYAVLITIASACIFSSLFLPAFAQNLSPCITGCLEPIAVQNGCVFQNTTCICGNTQFQSESAACLQEKCTAEEQQEAIQLQKRQCGPLAGTPTTPIPGSSTSVSNVTASTTEATTVTTRSPSSLPTTTLTGIEGSSSTGTLTGSATASSQSNGAGRNLPMTFSLTAILIGCMNVFSMSS